MWSQSNELVVNLKPEIPLKVPLERASLHVFEKVELLKRKNLSRYEVVALNLEKQANQIK